jgi:hypothetical protein
MREEKSVRVRRPIGGPNVGEYAFLAYTSTASTGYPGRFPYSVPFLVGRWRSPASMSSRRARPSCLWSVVWIGYAFIAYRRPGPIAERAVRIFGLRPKGGIRDRGASLGSHPDRDGSRRRPPPTHFWPMAAGTRRGRSTVHAFFAVRPGLFAGCPRIYSRRWPVIHSHTAVTQVIPAFVADKLSRVLSAGKRISCLPLRITCLPRSTNLQVRPGFSGPPVVSSCFFSSCSRQTDPVERPGCPNSFGVRAHFSDDRGWSGLTFRVHRGRDPKWHRRGAQG